MLPILLLKSTCSLWWKSVLLKWPQYPRNYVRLDWTKRIQKNFWRQNLKIKASTIVTKSVERSVKARSGACTWPSTGSPERTWSSRRSGRRGWRRRRRRTCGERSSSCPNCHIQISSNTLNRFRTWTGKRQTSSDQQKDLVWMATSEIK